MPEFYTKKYLPEKLTKNCGILHICPKNAQFLHDNGPKKNFPRNFLLWAPISYAYGQLSSAVNNLDDNTLVSSFGTL